jgi:hypothetical protein
MDSSEEESTFLFRKFGHVIMVITLVMCIIWRHV